MKKIVSIIMSLLLLFSLSSCALIEIGPGIGNNNGNNNNNNDNSTLVTDNGTTDKIDLTQIEDLADLVDTIDNSVIGISLKYTHKTMINGSLVESTDTESVGSGVIYKRFENYDQDNNLVSYTYYVATNRHVITGSKPSEYTYNAYVYLGEEDIEIKAEIVGYDEKVDLALVKFVYKEKILTAEFGDSDSIRKGEYVIAIGNPDGFDYYGSVTLGVISGTERYIADDTDDDGVNDFNGIFIQHDAAINPGNSGGGIFTTDGKFIGMNTLKIVQDEVEGMGFAIPSNVIKSLLENYLEKGLTIVRPRLGITGSEVRELTPAVIASSGYKAIPDIYGDEAPYGLYVADVTIGGSVYGSGISKDDIILEFDGVKLTRMNILSAKLNSLTDYFIGSKVEITYYSRSQNKVQTVTITLK